ncbi:MAG: hypothetical protein HKO93_05055 [Flavobacteriales bacterium]|nr:hypothetical protein [Flavobacteriales bacterium]
MKRLSLMVILIPLLGLSQDPTPPNGLTGTDLRDWLRDNWYTPWHNDLGYSGARIAMFGTIDNEDGVLECVYSGFTQPAEEVTFPDPINTEHTVPQSFFDSQLPMRSDIHHLFTTHSQANSTRGSLPFGEVNDNQADEWLIGSAGNYSESSNIPSSDIDDYSEIQFNVYFEPREVNKGNTARAIFYFYTMYPDVGDITSVADINTLFAWHQNDPPDAMEIERDEQIQAEQGNYNPYVRLPELVDQAWDINISLNESKPTIPFQYYPNERFISFDGSVLDEVLLLDIGGNLVRSYSNISSLSLPELPSGIYLIQMRSEIHIYNIKLFLNKD